MIREIAATLEKDMHATVEVSACEMPARLPVLYRTLFEYYELVISGQVCVIACRRDNHERLAPARIKGLLNHMQTFFNVPLVYAGSHYAGHDAERLVGAGVPFIAPKRYVYLPFMWTKLPLSAPETPVQTAKLSTCAQLMLLGALERRLPYAMSYADVQSVLEYSRPVVNEAMRQLEALGLGMREMNGRKRSFRLAYEGRELWNYAQADLRSPCNRTVGVEELPVGVELTPAGEDALALCSRLAEHEHISCYATCCPASVPRAWKLLPEREAPFRIQLWDYHPATLVPHGVDPLSLILTLRTTPHPRVEQAIEETLNQFPW